jgi:hypothetical protein
MSSPKNTFALLIIISANTLMAQDFKALYSCSSGNEEKPITYAFNSKYMLRDGASEIPFQIVANYKDGELMYTGFVRGESFKHWDEMFGFTDYSMKKWSSSFSNSIYLWDRAETKHEYILRKALNCTIDEKVNPLLRNNSNLNYDRLKIEDKSNVDFSYADSCEKSLQYASINGISNIVEYFKNVNFNKLIRQEGAVRKSLVVINTKKGEIWESLIGSKIAPKNYKCSIISVDVPKITPLKDKMFTENI